MITEYN